jgi:hypothetical protein
MLQLKHMRLLAEMTGTQYHGDHSAHVRSELESFVRGARAIQRLWRPPHASRITAGWSCVVCSAT